MHLSGQGCGGFRSGSGSASAYILGPDGVTQNSADVSGSVSTCNVLDTEITVPVQATAGTPFLLSFSASAYGTEGGSGNMGATIVFAGLPAGSSVTSCQGFHQDFPVPVARTTWGSLKTRYR